MRTDICLLRVGIKGEIGPRQTLRKMMWRHRLAPGQGLLRLPEAERSLEAMKCKESQGPRFDWEGVCVLKYILSITLKKISWLCSRACGILVPQPGIEPTPLHWQQEALIAEPPGKSPGASLLLREVSSSCLWPLDIGVGTLMCSSLIISAWYHPPSP